MPLGFLRKIGRGIAQAAPGVGRAVQQSFGPEYRKEQLLKDELDREKREKDATRSFLAAIGSATDAGQIRTLMAGAPQGVSVDVLKAASERADTLADKQKDEGKKRGILEAIAEARRPQVARDVLPTTMDEQGRFPVAEEMEGGGGLMLDTAKGGKAPDFGALLKAGKQIQPDRIEAEIGAAPIIRSLSAASPEEAERKTRTAKLQDELSDLQAKGGDGEIVQGMNGIYKLKVTRKIPIKLGKGERFDGGGGGGSSDPEENDLVNAIIDNPSLYDRMSASTKDEVTPLLHKKGFKFPVPLSDTARTRLADFDVALSDLAGLEKRLREPGVGSRQGPVAGRIASVNPWDTLGQDIQAEINGVKQTVGKGLEGGVLRKEDEEKYKKILPTLSDTPEVAAAKIANLQRRMTNARAIFGKRLSEGKTAGVTEEKLLDSALRSELDTELAESGGGAGAGLPTSPKKGDTFIFREGPGTFNGTEWVLN